MSGEIALPYKPEGTKIPFRASNPYMFENTQLYLKSIDDTVELLGIEKDINRKHIFALKCKCGTIFKRAQNNINRNKNAIMCTDCYAKVRGQKKALLHLEQRMEMIKNAGYDVLSSPEDIRRHNRIYLKTKEGYLCSTNIAEIEKGNRACIFSGKYNKENLVHNIKVFCKNNNIETEILGLVDGEFSQPHINCRCECGNTFETNIYSFMYGKNRCNTCAIKTSKYCIAVEELLEESNISFKKEVKFEDCKDIFPLPFDYQIEKNNGLIEVDGELHYCHSNFKKTPLEKEIAFRIRKQHDAMKDEYCKKNGIPFLRVSYKDIKNGSYKNKIMQFVGV